MNAAAQPRLVVVGGPNGAGKTTLAREYALEHGLRYLGADDIAAQMNPADPAAVRVAAGGHDVPEADVRRRFRRSLRQFMDRYRLIADDWTLVFNGESAYDTVAQGQGQDVQAVFDEVLWTRFLHLLITDPYHADTDSD